MRDISGLTPILEPEVDINAPDKSGGEERTCSRPGCSTVSVRSAVSVPTALTRTSARIGVLRGGCQRPDGDQPGPVLRGRSDRVLQVDDHHIGAGRGGRE